MLDITTLHFLIDLSLNNNKAWFDDNRRTYEAAKEDFLEFIGTVINATSTFDSTLKGLSPKECMFRINRDVRFSKDKSPYKIHFGASISAGGRKQMDTAGYYFHLEPGRSFAGGGLYNPGADKLQKIRKHISSDYDYFLSKAITPQFKKIYGDLDRSDEYLLKRVPKGFVSDDPASEYLKFKSYIGTVILNDEDLPTPNLLKLTVEAFKALTPLNTFINATK